MLENSYYSRNSVVAYLGLGGNLGEPGQAIKIALRKIDDDPNIVVREVSSLYQTAPIGLTAQPDFFNAVARIETSYSPENLLATTLHIENLLGRVRTERWAPRVIDIDILLYGDLSVSTAAITLPHPRMFERAFVLVPLSEIAPDLVGPLDMSGHRATIAAQAARLAKATRIVKTPWPIVDEQTCEMQSN